jgi:uracil-DNA glycosylase
MSRFPFGQQASRRPSRPPLDGEADLMVLGAYPSALHIRWTPPDGVAPVGALAVDDEPTLFWDGADARDRAEQWRERVGWREDWGWVGHAGSNGSSGRQIVKEVLAPLGVKADQVYFTNCLPTYFLRQGRGSQHETIATRYNPFAVDRDGLEVSDLPIRPSGERLVRQSLEQEGDALREEIAESGAPRIVTLGQEAADVLAQLCGAESVRLLPDESYGAPRGVTLARRSLEWLPLTHPAYSNAQWRQRHDQWATALV